MEAWRTSGGAVGRQLGRGIAAQGRPGDRGCDGVAGTASRRRGGPRRNRDVKGGASRRQQGRHGRGASSGRGDLTNFFFCTTVLLGRPIGQTLYCISRDSVNVCHPMGRSNNSNEICLSLVCFMVRGLDSGDLCGEKPSEIH